MAISVNWVTGVISVPKADMAQTQISPFEIRELDIDTLRIALRDLEDDPDGRPWPQTHRHNTEVTFGGVTYARQVIILAPYTITFEDGVYRVSFTGANTNAADVVNLNNVSIQPNNSTGLSSPTMTQAEALQLIKLLKNEQVTNDTTGKLQILDDDDVTVLLESNLYEDVAKTQLYRGKGAQVRERLQTP